MPDEELKHCPHCGRDLPRSQFYVDRKRKDGLTTYCKDYSSEYYAQNTDRMRRANRATSIRKRYGLTAEKYDNLMAQGCSLCGEQEKRIVMDHCHASGRNREPLCDTCNVALGAAQDDPALLRKMADYLERHAAP